MQSGVGSVANAVINGLVNSDFEDLTVYTEVIQDGMFDLIEAGKATCQVLDTPAKWFGVTYANDRQMVVDKIQALVEAGVYPNKLF